MKFIEFRFDRHVYLLPFWSLYSSGGTFMVLLPQKSTQWRAGSLLVGNVTRPIILAALHLELTSHLNPNMPSDVRSDWSFFRSSYLATKDRVATAGNYFFRSSGSLVVNWGSERLGLSPIFAKTRDCSRAVEELLHGKVDILRQIMIEHRQ